MLAILVVNYMAISVVWQLTRLPFMLYLVSHSQISFSQVIHISHPNIGQPGYADDYECMHDHGHQQRTSPQQEGGGTKGYLKTFI